MGFIYILTNESMPGLIKVGLTTRSPKERAKELNSTGVPTSFEVAAYWRVDKNLGYMETKCHQLLKEFRVSSNREFFRIQAEDAKKILSPMFLTAEEIDNDKRKKRVQQEKERAQRQEANKQREKQNEQASEERLQNKIESLEYDINSVRARIKQAHDQLIKPESTISLAISKFTVVSTSLVALFFTRVAPFVFALLGFVSGEGVLQSILFAGGFYVVGIFVSMLLSGISMVLLAQVENLRRVIFGNSHKYIREQALILETDLTEKLNELNRLKS
ncbi:GIY-YIG nuclease family protein [Vibrio diabolicus]|uniref:GIY-YIG nuclease family protein n=1 Tax=Vibrio diabolicus TaxID=50719 RepID=UPI002940A3CE|nr:GIY-YIG nuclease family protein [Vibrio diabolicus]MDV5061762.1 GIY-YIG nuclease family protein [Vibrio diabolicus]